MIRVIDEIGTIHEYPESDSEFSTEEMTNNLIVETPTHYAVFAEGKWIKAEKVNDAG